MPLIDHHAGNYRFLPGIAPYSCIEYEMDVRGTRTELRFDGIANDKSHRRE